MFLISSGLITNSESVPLVPVLLSPCAKFTHYFPHAIVHVSLVTGSLARFWYCEIVLPVTGWTTGAQKCSILMEVRILSSSLLIWWVRKYLGLVLHMFAANAVNASSKIMRVFWNCGSGSYGLVTSCVSYINTGWGCVLSLLSANGVFISKNSALQVHAPFCLLLWNFFLTRPFSSSLFLPFYPVMFRTNQVPWLSRPLLRLVLLSPLNLVEVCQECWLKFCVD